MKQITKLKVVALSIPLYAITFLLSVPALATSVFGSSCPQKFIATVTNVEEVQAGAFPKVEVDFQVIQNLKGDQISSKKIQIVKNGPIEFKSGEIYTIESRDGWLCSATTLSKI
jgi:hypothetical protein